MGATDFRNKLPISGWCRGAPTQKQQTPLPPGWSSRLGRYILKLRRVTIRVAQLSPWGTVGLYAAPRIQRVVKILAWICDGLRNCRLGVLSNVILFQQGQVCRCNRNHYRIRFVSSPKSISALRNFLLTFPQTCLCNALPQGNRTPFLVKVGHFRHSGTIETKC